MAFEKQTYIDGITVVTKQHMDNIENGIIENQNEISKLKKDIENLEVSGGTVVGSAIDYDQNVKAINHRGYSTEAPENTIPAYIMSKEKGFKYVECDVSFTSDGVAVLLHDGTIDRTSDGSGSISSLTYEQVLQYDFGSWKSSTYKGTKIPTFEEFIMYCKGLGLHPYIELKSNGGYTQEQINGVVDIVEKCGMKGKVTYISFNATFLDYVKQHDSKARLGYLVSSITSSVITTTQGLMTETNEVFLDSSDYDDNAVQLCLEANIPLEIWTINSQSVIENMNHYVSGVTSDNLVAGKILYDKYSKYKGIEIVSYSITNKLTNATNSNSISSVVENGSYTANIIPNDGYVLTNVTVVMGGIDVTNTVYSGGVISISNVIGDVVITVIANLEDVGTTTYTITNSLTNVTSDNSTSSVEENTTYIANLTPISGYTLSTVRVTMGGTDVTSNVYSNGVITISQVNGNVIITATASEVIELREYDLVDGSIINYDFANYDGGSSINNIGTLGSSGNATVTLNNGTASKSSNGGIILTNEANFSVATTELYSNDTGEKGWTWLVHLGNYETSSQKYQRVCRGNNDIPSIYYNNDTNKFEFKLFTKVNDTSFIYLNRDIMTQVNGAWCLDIPKESVCVFASDGDYGHFYLNGIKLCSMNYNSLQNPPTSIGCGDTENNKGYYFDSLEIRRFALYDKCLSESEIMSMGGDAVQSGKLLYNWDFTNSLKDTVRGETATTTATQDTNGISFNAENQYIQLTTVQESMVGKTIEIDMKSSNLISGASGHTRMFCIKNSNAINTQTDTGASGFIWRYNSNIGWTWYKGNSWDSSRLDTTKYPINYFDNKTIRLKYANDSNTMTLSCATIGSNEFTELGTFNYEKIGFLGGYLIIGGSSSNHLYNCTISGVRIYQN